MSVSESFLDTTIKGLAGMLGVLYLFGFAWYPSLAAYALLNLFCGAFLILRIFIGSHKKISNKKNYFLFLLYGSIVVDQIFYILVESDPGTSRNFLMVVAVTIMIACELAIKHIRITS